jgi:hypothetical protein
MCDRMQIYNIWNVVTWCFASLSWTSTEWCAGALLCDSSQFFLRQSFLRWIPENNSRWVEKQFKHYLAFSPLLSQFLLFLAMIVICRWPIVVSIWKIIQKTPCFISCYDLIQKCPIFVSTIDQVTSGAHAIITLVLRQDARNTVVGNTRHVQVIFVASTMANPCCCDFIYCLEMVSTYQHWNFFDLEFNLDRSRPTSVLIILQTVSSLCKMLVPLKHNTTAQGFFHVCLLDHLKCSASRFA